jgi:hypothetical protein
MVIFREKMAEGVAQVVEHLRCKREALRFKPQSYKKKGKNKNNDKNVESVQEEKRDHSLVWQVGEDMFDKMTFEQDLDAVRK